MMLIYLSVPMMKLNKLICTLNLEKYNIDRINSLIFSKKSKLESELVKTTYDDDEDLQKKNFLSYQPVGFMKINF